jgi:hypothetical protein
VSMHMCTLHDMLSHLSNQPCCLQEQLTQDYTSMIPSLTALAHNMVRELDPQVRANCMYTVRTAEHAATGQQDTQHMCHMRWLQPVCNSSATCCLWACVM